MKVALGLTVMFIMFVFVGCTQPSFPLSGTWTGTATIDDETSDMTLELVGEYSKDLYGSDSWTVSGTVSVFEWENSPIDGHYSTDLDGGLLLQLDTDFIGDYFFAIENATYSAGEISGVCAKCTQSGYGQKIGSFTVTK